MKKYQILLILSFLLLTTLACEAVMGPEEDYLTEPSVQESVPQDAPPTQPEVEAPSDDGGSESCLEGESYHPENGLCYLDGGSAEALFTSMMAGVTEYDEDFEENLLGSEDVLVKYDINGSEISSPEYEDVDDDLVDEQNNTALQEKIWDFYAAMIPAEDRDFVSHYVIMTDGLGGTLAAVEQNPDAPTLWMLNVDISDTENLEELTFTLIHEYGHLLTLNTSQVDIDEELFYNAEDEDARYEAESNCDTISLARVVQKALLISICSLTNFGTTFTTSGMKFNISKTTMNTTKQLMSFIMPMKLNL